jgi:hypothetical protein
VSSGAAGVYHEATRTPVAIPRFVSRTRRVRLPEPRFVLVRVFVFAFATWAPSFDTRSHRFGLQPECHRPHEDAPGTGGRNPVE